MTSQMVEIHTPGLEWFLSRLETEFHPVHSIDTLINTLKRRSIRNPTATAIATAQLFLRLMAAHKWHSLQNLLEYVVSVETRLSAAVSPELSVHNITRRIIGIIREEAENNGLAKEYHAAVEAVESLSSVGGGASSRALLRPQASFVNVIFDLLSRSTTTTTTTTAAGGESAPETPPPSAPQRDIRPPILQDIQELIDEIEGSDASVAEYSTAVVHGDEVLLTYGLPAIVRRFLLRAAQKRKFTAVVVEGSPNQYVHTHAAAAMRKRDVGVNASANVNVNANVNINVIVVADADVQNLVARVDKVVVAANYVLANGSLVAPAGTLNVMRAAKKAAKPVVVLAGSHALCPTSTVDIDRLLEMGPPVSIGYDEGYLMANASFPNPMVEFIDRGYVDVFVTNNGLVSPSAINRAALDLYHLTEQAGGGLPGSAVRVSFFPQLRARSLTAADLVTRGPAVVNKGRVLHE